MVMFDFISMFVIYWSRAAGFSQPLAILADPTKKANKQEHTNPLPVPCPRPLVDWDIDFFVIIRSQVVDGWPMTLA